MDSICEAEILEMPIRRKQRLVWRSVRRCFPGVVGGSDASELLQQLLIKPRDLGMNISTALNTPCRNSVACSLQPKYSGDLKIERRLTALTRWHAPAMVVRANRASNELGTPSRHLRISLQSVRDKIQSLLPLQ